MRTNGDVQSGGCGHETRKHSPHVASRHGYVPFDRWMLHTVAFADTNTSADHLPVEVIVEKLQAANLCRAEALSGYTGKRVYKDETKFADRVRAAADADAAKKLSDKSRGKTAGMISQMQLSSRGKTELYQGKLHQRVERAMKRGVKWDAIEADIRRKVSELYAADEKSQERVGQFQDTLSEVEL